MLGGFDQKIEDTDAKLSLRIKIDFAKFQKFCKNSIKTKQIFNKILISHTHKKKPIPSYSNLLVEAFQARLLSMKINLIKLALHASTEDSPGVWHFGGGSGLLQYLDISPIQLRQYTYLHLQH